MKNKIFLISIISIITYITGFSLKLNTLAASNEDKALNEIAQSIFLKADKLKGKRISMFKFTSIEGNESSEAARISQCLLERLFKNESLTFVDRLELKKIVGEQELQKTGLVDPDLISETIKMLPIDYMITGTFAYIKSKGYISVRILKVTTGEIFAVKSTEYATDTKKEDSKDSPEAIALYKASPDELDRLNKIYYDFMEISENRPINFLTFVLSDTEFEQLKKEKPRYAKEIRERKLDLIWHPDPMIQQRVNRLKNGLTDMKKMYPSRYEQIMQKKIDLLSKPQRAN